MVMGRMANDCVVTALANYTGIEYEQVFDVLNKVRSHREGNGNGYFRETWLFTLACLTGRQPRQDMLFVHGLLRFAHVIEGRAGHLVVIRADGRVVDGSLAQSDAYHLERYLQMYPHYVVDEVWR